MTATDFQRVFRQLPGLYVVLSPDPGFTILGASDAYLRATRTDRDIVGRGIFDAFGGDHPPNLVTLRNLRESLDRVVATRAPDSMALQNYDIRRPDAEGSGFEERFWTAENVPVLADDGALSYIIHRVEGATQLARITELEHDERTRLAEANSQFQAIYDQGLFAGRLDLEGIVIDVNRSSLEMCGYVRDDVIGKPFWACGWWNRAAEVQKWVKAGVEQAIRGEPFRGESEYFWADGTTRIVDFACMPIKDENGDVLFVVPTGMDITERVAAKTNARAMEVLESISEGFFSLDRDWRFTYLNRKADAMLGRGARDLIGKVIWDEFPQLARGPVQRALRRALDNGEDSSVTFRDAGHARWYEIRPCPAADGISVYFHNVTALHDADGERERLISESDRQRRIYEAALSNTPDLIYVWDLEHRFTYANEALLAMWGVPREQALGKNCLELGYEPWHAEMHDREIEQVIATKRSLRGEVPFTGTNGRRIYDYILVPVIGPNGDVVAVAGTTRDITDRQQAEQAIREQAQRLTEADRAKDEFLATLSHELRNPLAPLRNSLYLLRLAQNRDPATERVLEMMERQVNHLVRLVDDLLEVSRISRGAFALRKERLDLADIVRNAIETSEPSIKAAGHRLRVSMPDEPIWLEGDPIRLAQILANLLNNAAKYTDEGGDIAVTVHTEGATAVIAVTDNGHGIQPESLPRMFEMFTRGDRASGHGQGGLGIGLALARRLAEMHAGSVDAKSDGPGRGSEFTVRLPLAPDQAGESGSAQRVDVPIPQKRILVVDDNSDAAESLGMILKFLGADVRVAHDGPEAIAAFHVYDPAVVLLDIGMPGMDGYEVARTLRERYPERQAAIVALTGWGQESDLRRAREAGFDHHLVKPAEIGALQLLLASIPYGDNRRAPAAAMNSG